MNGWPMSVVSIIGAESTGKTTLAQRLGEVLAAPVLAETLREWVDRHGRLPSRADQGSILAEQMQRESVAVQRLRTTDSSPAHPGRRWLICDAGPLMTAVYSLQYFDDESLLVEAARHQRTYTRTLWCDTDIAWIADPGQRDGTGARAATHDIIRDVLERFSLRNVRVAGPPSQRVESALTAIGADRPE